VLKELAQQALKKLYKDETAQFSAIPCGKFDKRRVYRSDRYTQYDMLCHINSHQSAGWLICKYFWSGACSVERALQKFNTASGDTGTLARHTKTHQSGKAVEEQNVLVRKLGPHGKETITEAVALAVCHDILPFSFAEKREGMTSFAGAIFRAGQATAVSETIDIHDMLPSAKLYERLSGNYLVRRDLNLVLKYYPELSSWMAV